MSAPRVTPSTPFEAWPLFMTLREVAIVRGQSEAYLRNACAAGRMWPPPIADEAGVLKPYRFDRELVFAAATGKLPRPRRLRLRRSSVAPSARRSA